MLRAAQAFKIIFVLIIGVSFSDEKHVDIQAFDGHNEVPVTGIQLQRQVEENKLQFPDHFHSNRDNIRSNHEQQLGTNVTETRGMEVQNQRKNKLSEKNQILNVEQANQEIKTITRETHNLEFQDQLEVLKNDRVLNEEKEKQEMKPQDHLSENGKKDLESDPGSLHRKNVIEEQIKIKMGENLALDTVNFVPSLWKRMKSPKSQKKVTLAQAISNPIKQMTGSLKRSLSGNSGLGSLSKSLSKSLSNPGKSFGKALSGGMKKLQSFNSKKIGPGKTGQPPESGRFPTDEDEGGPEGLRSPRQRGAASFEDMYREELYRSPSPRYESTSSDESSYPWSEMPSKSDSFTRPPPPRSPPPRLSSSGSESPASKSSSSRSESPPRRPSPRGPPSPPKQPYASPQSKEYKKKPLLLEEENKIFGAMEDFYCEKGERNMNYRRGRPLFLSGK